MDGCKSKCTFVVNGLKFNVFAKPFVTENACFDPTQSHSYSTIDNCIGNSNNILPLSSNDKQMKVNPDNDNLHSSLQEGKPSKKVLLSGKDVVPGNCLFVDVRIAKIPFKTLIDSCSVFSVIELIAAGCKFTGKRTPLRMANGKSVTSPRFFTLDLEFGGRPVQHNVIVLKDSIYPLLLGVDFCAAAGIVTDYDKRQWWFSDAPNLKFQFSSTPLNLQSCASLAQEDLLLN